jgi:sugar fermentation stimulation protein A
MKYNNIIPAKFISRPNRFIAFIEVDGKEEICHVKNTGRCKELLIPGATVYVDMPGNPFRKTKYDLIAVRKGQTLINMDSQAPNKVFYEWAKKSEFFGSSPIIRPEFTYGKSRLDFFIESGERKIFVEVKGVTLEEDGVAMFPDAPTERGTKHLNELSDAVRAGYESYVFFIIQMKGCHIFIPNEARDPSFAKALKEAKETGVNIFALDSIVESDSLIADEFVKVKI